MNTFNEKSDEPYPRRTVLENIAYANYKKRLFCQRRKNDRKISVPGDKIYVWIKDVNDELYPKIDIDSGRGFELTYEFDPKSFKILPPRFAKFVKNPSTNRFQRVKIEKNELPPDLQTLHNHVMKALTS